MSELQKWFDQPAAKAPTRLEVLGAFAALRPKGLDDATLREAIIQSRRIVAVNVNPGGMVHEPHCRWLTGAFGTGELDAASYQLMRADDVPAGKRHCSYCA